MIKTNSLQAWFLAARPKTLTSAAAPVIVALASGHHLYGSINWLPALLCLLFAFLMQIDANLINDYFDCIGGIDTKERLGPERACSQGWVTLKAMRLAIGAVTILACVTGMPLILWGGWECILVGLCCITFCFLYTTLFSKIALGDILVLMFFGIIPVGYTFFFQSSYKSILDIPTGIWYLALAQGLVTDCLLLINNFRDRETDRLANKITLVTIIGTRAAKGLYASVGIIACVLAHLGISKLSNVPSVYHFIPFMFLPIHIVILKQMHDIDHGSELNRVLGITAMSIFVFSVLILITFLIV